MCFWPQRFPGNRNLSKSSRKKKRAHKHTKRRTQWLITKVRSRRVWSISLCGERESFILEKYQICLWPALDASHETGPGKNQMTSTDGDGHSALQKHLRLFTPGLTCSSWLELCTAGPGWTRWRFGVMASSHVPHHEPLKAFDHDQVRQSLGRDPNTSLAQGRWCRNYCSAQGMLKMLVKSSASLPDSVETAESSYYIVWGETEQLFGGGVVGVGSTFCRTLMAPLHLTELLRLSNTLQKWHHHEHS